MSSIACGMLFLALFFFISDQYTKGVDLKVFIEIVKKRAEPFKKKNKAKSEVPANNNNNTTELGTT